MDHDRLSMPRLKTYETKRPVKLELHWPKVFPRQPLTTSLQICGAIYVAPLNLSRTENESPNARPVGLSCKQCLLSHAKATASTGFTTGKEGAPMKKLHPNCPPKGAPIRGFARSVIHWRSGLRIYPKTAKAFPIRGRKGGNDKRQLTLAV